MTDKVPGFYTNRTFSHPIPAGIGFAGIWQIGMTNEKLYFQRADHLRGYIGLQ